MKKITILFGNGLGRAIDAQAFDLKSGLQKEYERLSADDQHYIHSTEVSLENEDELERSHILASYASEISKIQHSETPFLTEYGMQFPEKRLQFIFNVANYFFNIGLDDLHNLPESFSNNLCKLINENQVNIATLNYDCLLYKELFNKNLLKGYNGPLVDGLTDGGFEERNLYRLFGKKFGWYLQLHGSPLFFTDKDNRILKSTINAELSYDNACKRSHIVLEPTKFKPDVITNSPLLRVYWDYFSIALNESEIVILFGYGNNDIHVNQAIIRAFKNNTQPNNKRLIIVSHDSDKTDSWNDVFDFIKNGDVILKADILKYDFKNI